jgi:membrane protease YdiL (CAAX protease family)
MSSGPQTFLNGQHTGMRRLFVPAEIWIRVAAVGYSSRATVARVTLGLFAVFLLFHASAAALGSDRGQAGLAVGAIVIAATIAVERALFATPASVAVTLLGLGRPHLTGVAAAGAVCVLLWLVIVVLVLGTGTSWTMVPGWLALVPGLFAQAGIAEETLFRGYLFRRMRQRRSFVRAAILSMLPFVAVHLILFLTMPWPIALAAVLLSVVLSSRSHISSSLGGIPSGGRRCCTSSFKARSRSSSFRETRPRPSHWFGWARARCCHSSSS